jgi:hypothetical protein
MKKDTKTIFKTAKIRLEDGLRRFSIDKDGYGHGSADLVSYVKLLASTNTKEAWVYLTLCLQDAEYQIVHREVANLLSSQLFRFHRQEEEKTVDDHPDSPA